MSKPIGTYTFLPWIRQGIANRIDSAPAGLRATVNVRVDLEGTPKGGGATLAHPIERPVELYGPGDIIGIDKAQISRIEPGHWVTNFEPNYLAAIEFYNEGFPWRYTPAPPNGRRLLPWLALIVLEEGAEEFKEGGNVAGKPLSYIDVTAGFADVFPDASEGWAWAHAHFNSELSTQVVETDATKAAQAAQQVIDTMPDTACSRILCPRKLKPKTGYHAFLIPAFESGRLAGLGRDPEPLFEDTVNELTPTSSAWGAYATPANRPDSTSFPFYHRWYFRTAENGDFESLVRLLKPKVVDSRVGHRDMDVTDPAPSITGIENPELGGVLRLGGALKAPLATLSEQEQDEFEKYDQWATPYPQPFQSQLAAFVNLADSYQQSGTAANVDAALDVGIRNDSDPLITPPIFGRWHALTERLLQERSGSDVPHRTNWVHDLNLDPRWRVAAGFGTTVIQKKQETYMEAAWDQIGDVVEANRRIRQAQLAEAAGKHLHRAHVEGAAAVAPAMVLLKTAPMMARVTSGGVTVHHRLTQSPMATAMTSSAMRRMLRPGGRLSKRLGVASTSSVAELIERANADEITAAPVKGAPDAILTPDALADATAPKTPTGRFWAAVGQWIRGHFGVALVLLLVLLLLIVLVTGPSAFGATLMAAVVTAAVAAWTRARSFADQQDTSDGLKEDGLAPGTVDRLPPSSDFTLTSQVDPRVSIPGRTLRRGETDNPEAARFKSALRDEFRLIDASHQLGEIPPAVPLDLDTVAADVVASIRPELTVPRWVWSGIAIPPRIREQFGDSFTEVMAYPEFDTPMYEPLMEADKNGFVPNLYLVEPDSVTLLETNQKFIEAYMVGLNHEFARELLWREYPTDQRGSYFRQFWDVRKKIAEASDKEAARERLKDIKPLHHWHQDSDLGENDNREEGTVAEEELVLVIRGELLKKYPNAIVTAQPARWQPKSNGKPDKTKERDLGADEKRIPPLYEARVAPDIYFFGFDLTAKEARGDGKVDDKPGWYFRIEEVPGDARFGFDISREGAEVNVWNDLAWGDVVQVPADGKHIKVADIPARSLVKPTGPAIEKLEQWEFDRQVPLDANVSAAELGYIALQTPVIMAIHASELLPDQEDGNG